MKKKLFTLVLIALFSLGAKAQLDTLLSFNNTNGKSPYNSIISDGTYLYGMTQQGGAGGAGVLYKVKPNGTGYINLLDFDGAAQGGFARGSLISDGTYLYGMTPQGGTIGQGLIFRIKTDGTAFDTLVNFRSINGEQPIGSLITDGIYLYGMTVFGGTNGAGLIFKIKTDGTGYDTLMNFNGINGQGPYGSLVSDGTYLYGMTQAGGANNDGLIFKIKTDGTGYAKLLDFNGTNGNSPTGSLISDGTYLYGMTESGGVNSKGLVFKIKPDGSNYADLLDFDGANGGYPQGSLISDGVYLYGITQSGGANSVGSLFRIKTDGTGYVDLADFNTTYGANPLADPLLIDGTLYGTTSGGGAYSDGTLFKYDLPLPGAALNFDGVDDYAVASNNAAMGIGNTNFSIEVDFQSSSPSQPDYSGLVSKGTQTGWTGIQLVVVNNHVAAEFTDGSNFFGTAAGLEGTSNICDGSWHHLTITVDFVNGVIKLFVDGVAEATVTNSVITTMNISNTADLLIGTEREGSIHINGNLDELRIWNRALCASEIQNNMNAEIKLPNSGINAYYQFNEGYASADNTGILSAVIDSSGNFIIAAMQNFASNGSTSNWVAPGAVTTGSYAAVYTAPTLTVTGNLTACVGQNTLLTATGATSYMWSTGDVTDTTSINQPTSGTYIYSVAGSDVNGCPATPTSVTVTVNAAPVISAASGNSHTCEGGAAVYNVTSNNPTTDTYQWNWVNVAAPAIDSVVLGLYSESGYATNSMTISPVHSNVWGPSGTWGVHCAVTNTAGCTAKSVIDTIFINPIPTAVTGGGAICLGQSFTITVSGVISYTLTGGNSVITPTANTSYTITGTDGNGCVSTPSVITVTVNPLPTVTLTANSYTICNGTGASATIQAGGATTYSWSTGATTSSVTINGTGIVTTITVTVTGIDGNGCANNASATIDEQGCLGIAAHTKNMSLTIYPNPSKGAFTIATGNYIDNTLLTLYNSIGQLVYTTTLQQQIETLNTKLAPGVYTIRVQNAQGTGIQHIIIAD